MGDYYMPLSSKTEDEAWVEAEKYNQFPIMVFQSCIKKSKNRLDSFL